MSSLIRQITTFLLLFLLLPSSAKAQELEAEESDVEETPDEAYETYEEYDEYEEDEDYEEGEAHEAYEEFDDDVPEYETTVRAPVLEDSLPQQQRINRERIEKSTAQSAAELLEQEANLHATTGSRGERMFKIRGFSQRQVSIVIDGVPAYLPYDGQLDLGKIPPGLIDDIVVLRPPGSLRFGPSGMGGTVSIRTREPSKSPLLSTRFEGGRGRFFKLGAEHSYEVGPIEYLIGGGIETRDSYSLSHFFEPTPNEDGGRREQSDRLVRHLVGRLRGHLPENYGWLEATAWHVDGSWSIPPSTIARPPRYWRMTDWRATVATLRHRWMPRPGTLLQEVAFVSLFDNLLDRYDDETYSTQLQADSFHSWYHDIIAGGFANARISLPRSTLLRLEAGARYESHQKDWQTGVSPDLEISQYTRALILAGGQLEAWPSSTIQISASLQSETELGLETSLSPSFDAMMGIRYEPDRPFALGFTVGRRSRLPTLRERFSGTAEGTVIGRVPNPDLQPEIAFHFGLDVTVQPLSWIRIELIIFEAEIQDLIEQIWLDSGTDQFQNISRARHAGVEASIELTPLQWLDIEIAYNYLYARSLDDENKPQPLSYQPAHQARLALNIHPLPWFELSTTIRLVGPQQFEDTDYGQWRELGSYVMWNARIGFLPYRGVRLWIQATNILDANVQSTYGFPEPGWGLVGGLQLGL